MEKKLTSQLILRLGFGAYFEKIFQFLKRFTDPDPLHLELILRRRFNFSRRFRSKFREPPPPPMFPLTQDPMFPTLLNLRPRRLPPPANCFFWFASMLSIIVNRHIHTVKRGQI